jgi:hypothetical protein
LHWQRGGPDIQPEDFRDPIDSAKAAVLFEERPHGCAKRLQARSFLSIAGHRSLREADRWLRQHAGNDAVPGIGARQECRCRTPVAAIAYPEVFRHSGAKLLDFGSIGSIIAWRHLHRCDTWNMSKFDDEVVREFEIRRAWIVVDTER